MRKSQKFYLDQIKEYLNTDNDKTPDIAAARRALKDAQMAGAEGTLEYEIAAADIERVALKDAYIKNDDAAYVAAGMAAFNQYKKVYAAALNKNPEIVKRAQEGALIVYESTSGLSSIGTTYAVKEDNSKALESWHAALTAVKEPVLTSNPQAQDAIKMYSQDTFIDGVVNHCLTTAYYKLEDKEAIKELEFLKTRAKGTDVKNTVYQVLATKYYSTNDSSAFESTLKEGAKKFPDESWYNEQLLNLYIMKEDYAAAIQLLDKAIAEDPNDDLYRAKGVLLEEQGKKEEALTYYQKALKMNPNSVMNNYSIGFHYFKKEDIDKALPYFEKAYSLDTEHEENIIGNALWAVYRVKAENAGVNTPEGKRWAEKLKKVKADYGIE